ncbi:MAG: helix-hairpin-helix domain-containing protein [Methyloprofundus sp.]|nr:helix-hairpin-helix domain-containing protein [Methyloprofundus sp.]
MKKFLMLWLLFSFNAVAAPVNINKAGAQEIADSLNGIGIKKAEAIVGYRKKNGKFNSADELSNVKGIGEKTIAKNKKDIKLK